MHHLYALLLFVLPLVSVGQNPWPSEDSEWNYISYWGWPPPPSTISYTKYYVDGTEMIQGKLCTRLLADAVSSGNYTQGTTPAAYLHFDGDTLWHYVANTFYPLVCFNAVPGDSWHPLPFDNASIDTACNLLPIEVLDTFTVNHSGLNYRGITIGNQQSDGHLVWGGSFDERTFKNPAIGYNGALFPFYNVCGNVVVDWLWDDLLCYSDSEIDIINDNITAYAGHTDCEYPWNLVGIEENELQPSIYPNPATDYLRIESQTPLEQVKLTDLAGRVALQQTFRQAHGDVSVDISTLPSGIYLLEAITDDGKRSVQKVVKR